MRVLQLFLSRRANCYTTAWIAAGLASVLAPIAVADVVVVTATRDNSIFDNGNSNGAGDAIFSGRTGNFGGEEIVQRGLVTFSVADGVPAGSRVVSASVELTLIQASPKGVDTTYTLHRLISDWGEGTSFAAGGTGAPPTTGDATWTHTFYPDQFWATTGGDFSATVSASQTVTTVPAVYTWGSTPQLVADVQSMLDDPSSDFGWVLIGDEATPFSARKFASKENPGVIFRPMLIIEFEPCPWDCGDNNGNVGIVDFLALLAQWGGPGTCDFDGGGVGINDFLELLGNWGPCP